MLPMNLYNEITTLATNGLDVCILFTFLPFSFFFFFFSFFTFLFSFFRMHTIPVINM